MTLFAKTPIAHYGQIQLDGARVALEGFCLVGKIVRWRAVRHKPCRVLRMLQSWAGQQLSCSILALRFSAEV